MTEHHAADMNTIKAINSIMQRLGYGSICFDCSGSVARGITVALDLMNEYEQQTLKSA